LKGSFASRIPTPTGGAIYPFVHSPLVLYFELSAWFEVLASESLFGVVADSCDIFDDRLGRFDAEFLVYGLFLGLRRGLRIVELVGGSLMLEWELVKFELVSLAGRCYLL